MRVVDLALTRKIIFIAALAAALGSGSAPPSRAANPVGEARLKGCAEQWQAMKETGKTHGLVYQAWMQQCLKAAGPSPRPSKSIFPGTDGSPPKDATAKCRDGSYTTTRVRAGACAGHGGVDHWLAN